MKKKKNNVVSEEIISEEDLYEESENYISETPIQEKGKGKIFASIIIIFLLIVIIGVLAFFVVQKYKGDDSNNPSTVVEEEPSSPYIDVSPSPTVSVSETPVPTDEPITEIPTPTEIPEVTPTPEVLNEQENSLDLEESNNSSLNLEEIDNETENIDEQYKDITVYYTESLKTFHKKDCPTIKDKDKIKTTAYSALKNGFEECSSCKPLKSSSLDSLSESDLNLLEEIEVFKTASNTKYHTKNCSILKNTGIKISLKDAIENNLEPCSLCNPKTLDNFKETNNNSNKNSNNETNNENTSKITITPKPISPTGTTGSKVTPTPTKTITPTSQIIPVTSLSITGGTVKVGENLQLYVSFAPVNAVSTLTYTTSNSNIAKISSSGIVTGISTGTVTISISAPNGVYASSIVNVVAKETTITPTSTPTPTVTPTPVPTQKPIYTDTTLDINNLGLTGISKFVYPSNINLIDMEAMSDWQAFIYKISANGGDIITTSSSLTLNVGGVTRLQLIKYNDNVWSLRIYDDLNTTLNKCALKAICTKISSMPDTIYSNIYDDYEVSEFIGERYRSIGDASIKSEISGGSTTYYIKDVNYEY